MSCRCTRKRTNSDSKTVKTIHKKDKSMRVNRNKTKIGDLVVAAFEKAGHYNLEPNAVSALAAQVVLQILKHAKVFRQTHAITPFYC